jgi:nudix-type nucleoside diphosphatase (YffH/AdpP family)
LAVVLGRKPDSSAARLKGHAVHWAEGRAFPLIVQRAGAVAPGVLVRGLTEADIARLDYYEGGLAHQTQQMRVETPTGSVLARVYVAENNHWTLGEPWALDDWQARFGAAVVAAAREVMALYGVKPAQAVMARYGQMLVQGGARVRAADAAPATLRRTASAQDVAVASRRTPYAQFFAVEEQDLRFRRFDGTMSAPAIRAAFLSGDATTVLPYDPLRDRVLLIEQFRFGPHARGDANPWQLEVIAGRIDAGETPEAAARREAHEEAGLTLNALLPICQYYPSPGAYAEFLYAYLAITDLPDGCDGTFGLASEAEDIRSHLISFDALMGLVDTGELGNGPTILSVLWLARERARLRGPFGP